MNKKALLIALILLAAGASRSIAQETAAPKGGSRAVAVSVNWHIAAGYMYPNETDLNGGFAVGLGGEYKKGEETVFYDLIYSPSSAKLSYPGWSGDVASSILQLGYMRGFGGGNKSRAGLGVQVHELNFKNIGRKTRTTIVGVAEHDLSPKFSARLQMAQPVKRDNIRFGDMATLMFNWNFSSYQPASSPKPQ